MSPAARPRQVVDAEQGHLPVVQVGRERVHVRVVADVLIAVGDHRTAPVPAPVPDDVHLAGEERVGGAHDRADVEVVRPVLDRDMEVVPPGVEVGDDRLHRPVAVPVHDVAPVAVGEQPLVVHLTGGPLADPGADAHLVGTVRHRVVGRAWLGTIARTTRRVSHADRLGHLDPRGRAAEPSILLGMTDFPALATAMLLGVDWLDAQYLLERFGDYALWGAAAIIFAECGLLVGFLLPGESLLFTVGLLVSQGGISYPLWLCCLVLFVRRDGRERLRLRHRREGRPPDLPSRGLQVLQEEVRRQDPRVLREVRQPRHRARPLRADRAHVHHRDGGRGEHGVPAVHGLQRRRRCRMGLRGHRARLLPRAGRVRAQQPRGDAARRSC